MSTALIEKLFAVFPPAEIAKATGWPLTTIADWKPAGNIPGYRRREILLQAIGNSKELPYDVAVYLDERHEVRRLYPAWPGFKAPDGPSEEAAAAMATRAPTLRDQVLELLKASEPFGLTSDECASKLGRTVLAIRPRLTELRRQGKIIDSGHRRPNDSGLRATVWQVEP